MPFVQTFPPPNRSRLAKWTRQNHCVVRHSNIFQEKNNSDFANCLVAFLPDLPDFAPTVAIMACVKPGQAALILAARGQLFQMMAPRNVQGPPCQSTFTKPPLLQECRLTSAVVALLIWWTSYSGSSL